jgi:hypothetical protein
MEEDEDLVFYVPQQFSMESASKALSERQIFIIAFAIIIIAGPFFFFVKDSLTKIGLVGLGFGVGFALAKIEIKGMILLDYLRIRFAYSGKVKVYYD